MGEVINMRRGAATLRRNDAAEADPRGQYRIIAVVDPTLTTADKIGASYNAGVGMYDVVVTTSDEAKLPELLRRGKAMLPPEIRDNSNRKEW